MYHKDKIQNLTPRPIAKQTLSTKNAEVHFAGLSLIQKIGKRPKEQSCPAQVRKPENNTQSRFRRKPTKLAASHLGRQPG
jgi:hypothetical protein